MDAEELVQRIRVAQTEGKLVPPLSQAEHRFLKDVRNQLPQSGNSVVLYHGTCHTAIGGIRRDGLRGDPARDRSTGVCLTPNKWDAKGYPATCCCWDGQEPGTCERVHYVITVRVARRNLRRDPIDWDGSTLAESLRPSRRVPRSVTHAGPIPLTRIVRIEKF